jgi:hypothetical protein
VHGQYYLSYKASTQEKGECYLFVIYNPIYSSHPYTNSPQRFVQDSCHLMLLIPTQRCIHTCKKCDSLSGDGGSITYHQSSASRHPNCAEECPGHALLKRKHTPINQEIKVLLVLPYDITKSDMDSEYKSWPNTSFIRLMTSTENEFSNVVHAIANAIPGFNHGCHFDKKTKSGYIYHWERLSRHYSRQC